MSTHIRDFLDREFQVALDPQRLHQLDRLVLAFEIRSEHPYVLQSNLIGVNKIIFGTEDRNKLFELFGKSGAVDIEFQVAVRPDDHVLIINPHDLDVFRNKFLKNLDGRRR